MFKDILLPVVLGEIPESAVRLACALAAADQGHVAALVAVSLFVPSTATWAYFPAGTYETMDEAAQAALRQQMRQVEQRLQQEAVAHEVRGCPEFWLTPSEAGIPQARYMDLVVLGVDRPLHDAQRKLFAGLLIASGRPVLLVPAAPAAPECERVVIAWKSSREAARALHDAMPLLRRASAVDLLIVDHDPGSLSERNDGKANDGAAHLVAHLRRHGVAVELAHRARAQDSTGHAIIGHARERDANLIVAGGFSHARALEQVVGGVTRHLLEHAPVPVLFSH